MPFQESLVNLNYDIFSSEFLSLQHKKTGSLALLEELYFRYTSTVTSEKKSFSKILFLSYAAENLGKISK